jgi:hypothetical protein
MLPRLGKAAILMNEQSLEGLTLAGWAGTIWNKHCRGVPLIGLEAALAHCMQHHSEWRHYWDALSFTKDPEISRIILHVHHDAMVKLQIDGNNPPKIKELYDLLIVKQFKEFEAIHTLVVAFSEEVWDSRSKSETFNFERYASKAEEYTRVAMQRPTWTRRMHEK